jgi:hypothetical protein
MPRSLIVLLALFAASQLVTPAHAAGGPPRGSTPVGPGSRRPATAVAM